MRRIVRWNPNNLSEREYGFNGGRVWRPALDIVENDDAYIVQAALPGLSSDDITINVENDVLTLSAENSSEDTSEEVESNERYLLRERHYGSLRRSVRLPANVDAAKAEATVENGVLTLTLPKREEAKPKSIEVKAA